MNVKNQNDMIQPLLSSENLFKEKTIIDNLNCYNNQSNLENDCIDLSKCLFSPNDIDISFEKFPYCYIW
jgi:hypothetical protein